jgi:hypothetical protein
VDRKGPLDHTLQSLYQLEVLQRALALLDASCPAEQGSKAAALHGLLFQWNSSVPIQDHCHPTSAGSYQSQPEFPVTDHKTGSSSSCCCCFWVILQPHLALPTMQEAENGSSGKVEITRKFPNCPLFNRRKPRVHFT